MRVLKVPNLGDGRHAFLNLGYTRAFADALEEERRNTVKVLLNACRASSDPIVLRTVTELDMLDALLEFLRQPDREEETEDDVG